MIIDFHTHIFPEKIAAKALDGLSHSGHVKYYVDGTLDALSASMKRNGIGRSVVLQVVTRAGQEESVNRAAAMINDRAAETGIYSFGGIHPDAADPKGVIRSIAELGLKGVKIHPAFTKVNIDDPRYLRIIDYANEYGLMVVTHAGYDVSFPGEDYCTPDRIRRVIGQLRPERFILAHMGGWECWQQVEELLAGEDVWLDTSFVLTKLRAPEHFEDRSVISSDGMTDEEIARLKEDYTKASSDVKGFVRPRGQMAEEDFVRLVRKHGADRVLFGSDSPWSSQGESVEALERCGLTGQEKEMILYRNASELLK